MAASASTSSPGERIASELSLADKWDSAWENVIRQSATGGLLAIPPSFIVAKSPILRAAGIAFGAGIGAGRAYTQAQFGFVHPELIPQEEESGGLWKKITDGFGYVPPPPAKK